MFVETVTASREELERWEERLRLTSDPPDALIAAIAWVGTDGRVTSLHVWDTAEAIADFFVERIAAIPQAERGAVDKPVRHGEPISVYLRR